MLHLWDTRKPLHGANRQRCEQSNQETTVNSITHPHDSSQEETRQIAEFCRWAYGSWDDYQDEKNLWRLFACDPYINLWEYPNKTMKLMDSEGICSHETAYAIISQLLAFYDHVSPETITLLNEYRNSAPTPSHNQPKTKKIYPGFVYLIQQVNGQHFKIGKSKDPDKRMSLFEVKLPFPIERICAIETDDMNELERELHETFANKRVDGEWFALDTEDVEYIKSLAGGAE